MKIEKKIAFRVIFHKVKLVLLEYVRALWAGFVLIGLAVGIAAFWVKVFF